MTANAIYLNRPLANWPRPNSLTDFVSSDHKNNKLQSYILINIILMTMAHRVKRSGDDPSYGFLRDTTLGTVMHKTYLQSSEKGS